MKINVKEVFKMYPELTTKINILSATPISYNNKNYVNVVFTDQRGNPVSMWFPGEFSDFAQSNVGKTVTATLRFYRPYGDRPANLRGLSLS